MRVRNADIAEIFDTVASLLEIEGANQFRVRAYRDAARTLHDYSQNVAEMVASGDGLPKLPGIGRDLEQKIGEIVRTGKLSQLEEIKRRTPESLLTLRKVPGLGPRRIRALYDELQVKSLDDLRRMVAKNGHKLEAAGFGGKIIETIRQEIERVGEWQKRVRIDLAEEVVDSLLEHLDTMAGIKERVVAGSYRRRAETVGDIDVLVTCGRNARVIPQFVLYKQIRKVVSQGTTRCTVALKSGLQVDLRVVPQESYGAALLYFTGAKAHSIALRKIALQQNIKLNEYGAFRGDERLAGRTEADVYRAIGLPYIEPELREDRGEIDAAIAGELPELIRLEDIRGDLHAHTDETDGRNTLEEMARAAKDLGYSYLAISDHSQSLRLTNGLDPRRLRKQWQQIDRVNAKLTRFTVLKSSEVDILEDGSLDFTDDVLRELELTVCSIHTRFHLPPEKQTERLLRAMDNPYCRIIGHPTGRMIGRREPYPIDMERVMLAAKERGVALEISAQPERLDLNHTYARIAKEIGVKLVICTDAHTVHELGHMRYGVEQARRGWIEAADVLNTRPLSQLKKFLKRK